MTFAGKLHISKADLPFWILGAIILFSAVGFGVYYYFDRYVHENETIVDRQARHFEDLVAKNPQNPDLRVATAEYYLDAGMVDQAIEQTQQALQINPDHQGAIILMGRAYRKKGDLESARSFLVRVVEMNKDNPMAKIDKRLEGVHYELGNVYLQQKNYPAAVESLKSALAIDYTDADVLYLLGSAYQKQNDHASAVKQFQSALRFVPDFTEAYQGLADSYVVLNQPTESSYARAMVVLTQGKYDDAAGQLESVVKQSPDFMPAYLGLGLAYEKAGKRNQAAGMLDKYLKAYPNDFTAQQALGRVSQGN